MGYSIRNYFRRLAEGYEKGAGAVIFYPLLDLASGVYGLAVGAIRFLYERKILKRKRLPFPVISVGNLSWGGTGKTPFVEYLARKADERRYTPLVLTRGYGQDEVEQLGRQLPRTVIGAGKNRIHVAEDLCRKHKIDLAILDDGLQHWPIERESEIVTVNAVNPFGNGRLIPRGILREPLAVLKRASVIVITHANLIKSSDLVALRAKIQEYAPQAFVAESFLEPLFFYRAAKRARVSLDRLCKQRVTTFSGIGNPRSFQMLLSQREIKPVRNFEFADHHPFSASELEEIKRVSESASVDEIVTTEKDFYRNAKLITETLNPLVLATRLRILSGEESLLDRIFRPLGAPRS